MLVRLSSIPTHGSMLKIPSIRASILINCISTEIRQLPTSPLPSTGDQNKSAAHLFKILPELYGPSSYSSRSLGCGTRAAVGED